MSLSAVMAGIIVWKFWPARAIVLEGEAYHRHPFDRRFPPLTIEHPDASGGTFIILSRRDRVEYDFNSSSGTYRVKVRFGPSGFGQVVRLRIDGGPELILWGPGGEQFADLDAGWTRLPPGSHRLRLREGEEPASPSDVAAIDVIRFEPAAQGVNDVRTTKDEIPVGHDLTPLGHDLAEPWTPAPDWLRSLETFSGEYATWTDKTFARRRGFDLLLLNYLDRDRYRGIVERAHTQGAKLLAPMSLHTWRWRPVSGRDQRRGNPVWLEEWALLTHPEWALVTGQGQTVSPFTTGYQEGSMRQPCLNAPGVAEAARALAGEILDTGVDGLFIDNVNPVPVCYGDRLGRHPHVDPTADNALALKRLIAALRKEVKTRGSDKVVVINPGGPARSFWETADGYGLESYLFEGRHDGPYLSFRQTLATARHYESYLSAGGAVLVFSYLPPASPAVRKEWAFYAAGCARLSGFAWTDWDSADGSGAEPLSRLRLGPAHSPMEEREGVWVRRFERGLAAVLPPGQTDTPFPLPVEGAPWRDEFTGLPASDHVILKAGTARIFSQMRAAQESRPYTTSPRASVRPFDGRTLRIPSQTTSPRESVRP